MTVKFRLLPVRRDVLIDIPMVFDMPVVFTGQNHIVDSGVPEQDSEIGGAGFRFSRSKIPVFAVQDTAPVQA